MRRKRLLWQIYPTYLLITLVSLSVVAWYASRSLRYFYLENTKKSLEARANLAGKYISSLLAKEDFKGVDETCKELGRKISTRITVILPSGKVIGDSNEDPGLMDNHRDRPEIREALFGQTGVSIRYSYTLKEDFMYLAIPTMNNGITTVIVRTSIPVTHISSLLMSIYLRIAAGGLIIAIGAAVITLIISHRLSRPLEDMRKGAERFAKGELDHRLQVPDSHEMAALAEAMNQMALELDKQIRTIVRQRSEQDAVLSSMGEGLLAVDENERIININQAAARLLGIEMSKAQGRTIQEIIRNTGLQRFVRRALSGAEPIEGDIVLRNGGEHFLHARGTTLRDAEGQKTGAVIVLTDVTSLRRLENVRRDFVANVSHELKTPITSIKGFVETLIDGAIKNPEDAERFLTIIAKQADRLSAIIEDLMTLARIEQEAEKDEIPLQQARLLDVLRDAIRDCEQKIVEKGMSIKLNCKEDASAYINPQLLEQTVVNLLDNAIKYSEPGGAIDVDCQRAEAGIVIRVRDYGCGIAQEHLPRLFERFYRVDKARSRELGGTGLGLAIVKHIVQAHKGRITAESTPGKGSVFSIYLPKT